MSPSAMYCWKRRQIFGTLRRHLSSFPTLERQTPDRVYGDVIVEKERIIGAVHQQEISSLIERTVMLRDLCTVVHIQFKYVHSARIVLGDEFND